MNPREVTLRWLALVEWVKFPPLGLEKLKTRSQGLGYSPGSKGRPQLFQSAARVPDMLWYTEDESSKGFEIQ